jgi:hypothetical protein
MPWCETCDKFHNPATIDETGTCPECGTTVEIGEIAQHVEEETVKVPWHFWVGVAAVIAYLGWRVIQGVGLLFW